MLFKLRNVKGQFAIGLRWAVDTRQGIEQIQFKSNLNYGIISSLKDKTYKKLKLAALTDDGYDKSVCLAGLFAKAYNNLIFIHRLSDSLFWLCIIKNGEVWSGVDLDKATAGDYVEGYEQIKKVVDQAIEDFKKSDIDLTGCLKCTDTAFSEFPQFTNVDFYTLISQARKYRRQNIIRYLEPYKVVKQKIMLVTVIIIIIGCVSYFVYRNHILHTLLHNQEVQEAKRKAAELKAKQQYFENFQKKIRQQWGYSVIKNVMGLFDQLPLQSKGWSLIAASYNPARPKQLQLELKRSNYGTLNSFVYAYTPDGKDGDVAKNSDSGKKTISINLDHFYTQENYVLNKKELQQKIPKNLYALISFMQIRKDMFNFQLAGEKKGRYGINSASFTLNGSALWQLIQLQDALAKYPTLIINNIDFKVINYDMSWQLKGEIYA